MEPIDTASEDPKNLDSSSGTSTPPETKLPDAPAPTTDPADPELSEIAVLEPEPATTNPSLGDSATDTSALDHIDTSASSTTSTENLSDYNPSSVDSDLPESAMPIYRAPHASGPTLTSTDSSIKSPKRFIMAYIVSIFSGLTLLVSGSILGYALFNHFLEPTKDSSIYFFDSAPLYLSMMSGMIVFAALYFLASQYVARSTSENDIDEPDWRIYKVAYAIFCAILLTSAASVLASLLYLPLSSAFATEDLAGYQIGIQVLGGLHVLLWIGLLIWQERLIKRGRNVWLQGTATTILAILLVVFAGIFLVGSKTDQRVDARTVSDLTTIASSITTYKSAHSGKLPETLSALDLKSTDKVKKRLGNYRYTVKENGSSSNMTPQVSVGANVIGNSYDDYFSSSSSELSYDSLFNTSSNSRYELCANFRTDTTKDTDNSSQISPLQLLTGASASNRDFAVHHKGQACFDL